MGDAAGRQVKLFECGLRAPGARVQLPEALAGRHRRCDFDAAAAAAAVRGAPAPHNRCMQVQLNVQLEIEELISIDMKAILMIGCMV